jgi:hypothetical protein
MKSRLILMIGLVAFGTAVSWAQSSLKQATVYESIGGKEVLDVLSKEGYKPELTKDSEGDPKITLKIQGKSIGVFFYDCNKTPFCTNLSISTGWDLKKPLDQKQLLKFNYDNRFARASIDDENDPYLESDFDFAGGATKTALAEWIKTYSGQINEFKSEFKL